MQQQRRGSVMKAAFLATLALIMTLAVATSLTFALFTDDVINESHVQAGNLTIDVEMIQKTGSVLNTTTGKLDPLPALANPVDLVANEDSIFMIENAVPTQTQTALIKVINNGIVAFTYDVTVTDVIIGENNAKDAASVALSEQVKVTIVAADADGKPLAGATPQTMYLSGAAAGNFTVAIEELAPNSAIPGEAPSADSVGHFLVIAEFEDIQDPADPRDNNDTEGGKVTFDIKISATQAT